MRVELKKIKNQLPVIIIGISAFLIILGTHTAGFFSRIELGMYDLRFRLRSPLTGLLSNSHISRKPEPVIESGAVESYVDIGNQYRNNNERFQDCGIDGICPGDSAYTIPDTGEKNGIWDEGEPFTDKGNGRRDNGQDVVLVEIDDESFRLIPEPYPYGRGTVWKRVVRNLTDAGASVIVFDLIFDKPDHQTLNLKSNLKNIRDLQIPDSAVLDGDDEFLSAVKYAQSMGTHVVLGAKSGFEATRLPYPDYLVGPAATLKPDDQTEEKPYSIGLVDHPVDLDGVSRKYLIFNTFHEHPGNIYNSLALEAVLQYKNIGSSPDWHFSSDEGLFYFGSQKVKSYRMENTFLLNYYGPPSGLYRTFNRYSVSDILDTEDYELADEDSDIMDIYTMHPRLQPFRDKIVIVGSSLLEDHDFLVTPYFSYNDMELFMPGLESHANAIQQIIDENYISVPTGSLSFEPGFRSVQVIIIMFFVVLTLIIGSLLTPLRSTYAAFAVFLLWLSISAGAFMGDYLWLFKLSTDLIVPNTWQWMTTRLTINVPPLGHSIMLPVVYPMASVIITFSIQLVYKLVIEHQDKQFLRKTFGTYIAPSLIDEMYQEKQHPKLGGTEGYYTAFFSDIQSFSSFSEQLQPADLVELLNEYLSEMTDILADNKGTLDKYIGDMIVAFFGAPLSVDNHEYAACLTAARMQEKLNQLHDKWQAETGRWPDIVLNMRNRIGINSGNFVTGNMGSSLRMNYTMIGDSVNTASRLESSAKQYGVYIQVAEDTYRPIADQFTFRQLDNVVVVGKSQPMN